MKIYTVELLLNIHKYKKMPLFKVAFLIYLIRIYI